MAQCSNQQGKDLQVGESALHGQGCPRKEREGQLGKVHDSTMIFPNRVSVSPSAFHVCFFRVTKDSR